MKNNFSHQLIALAMAFILAFGISLTGFFGSAGSKVYAATSFSDVSSNYWAYDSVKEMSRMGILNGFTDGTFRPEKTVTYGEFIKMAVVAVLNKDPGVATTAQGYTHWASKYYKAAIDADWFSGYSIKESYLNEPIPRSAMAQIAAAALNIESVKYYEDCIFAFSDIDFATDNFYSIFMACENGIITGYQDGTFKPNGVLTRAESTAVIFRLIDKSKRILPDFAKKESNAGAADTGEDAVKTEYAADSLGFLYTTVKLDKYVTNYDDPKYQHGIGYGDEIFCLWTDTARLYKEPILVTDFYKTWEEGTATYEKAKDKEWNDLEGPYFAFTIKTQARLACFCVKDNRIIRQCRITNHFSGDETDVICYVYPTEFDYLVLVENTYGTDEVCIYPNPFK